MRAALRARRETSLTSARWRATTRRAPASETAQMRRPLRCQAMQAGAALRADPVRTTRGKRTLWEVGRAQGRSDQGRGPARLGRDPGARDPGLAARARALDQPQALEDSTSSSGGTSSSSGGTTAPMTCAQAGQAVGCCVGNTVYYCKASSSSITSKTCSNGEVCGWDSSESYYYCVPAPGGADPSGTYPQACD